MKGKQDTFGLALNTFLKTFQRNTTVREKLRPFVAAELFAEGARNDQSWLNITGIPDSQTYQGEAQDDFDKVRTTVRDLHQTYQDIWKLMEAPVMTMALEPGEDDTLKKHLRVSTERMGYRMAVADLWYRELLDAISARHRWGKMVQLEQEVAQVQVNPELEMIYQESRVDADNGVLIAKHKTMYAAEYEKLNQLREKLKMARERCLPLTNLESRKALGRPPDSVIAAFLVATDVNPPSEVLAAIRDHQVSLWGGQYALGDGKAGYAAVMKVLKKLQEIGLDMVEVRGIGTVS